MPDGRALRRIGLHADSDEINLYSHIHAPIKGRQGSGGRTRPVSLLVSGIHKVAGSRSILAITPPPPSMPAASAEPAPEATTEDVEKGEDEQELLEELWPRETKAELQYEIALPGGGGAFPLPITQDLMGCRFPYKIGNIVWDAAVAMHHFFQDRAQFPLGCFQGKCVLELGSGTGLVGITLAMLGANVVLTDLPDALDILRHNVERCFTEEALARLRDVLSYPIVPPTVEPLPWGEPVPPKRRRRYDLVVGSDITYDKAAIQNLLRTLEEVTMFGGDAGQREYAEVYVAHLERGDEPEFFEALDRDLGFAVREVHKEDVAEGGIARKLIVHVFLARKREGISDGDGLLK